MLTVASAMARRGVEIRACQDPERSHLFAASRPLGRVETRFSFLLTAAAGYSIEENAISSVRGAKLFAYGRKIRRRRGAARRDLPGGRGDGALLERA